MSQAFKVTIVVAYREGSSPVTAAEIADYLRWVLTPGGWPGIILGTGLNVGEIEDPNLEPVLSKIREAARAEGVDS